MLRTDLVVETLKQSKKPMSFDSIWDKIKNEFKTSFSKSKLSENQLKNDLFISLIQDEKLLLVDNNWDLKENYTLKEIEKIYEKMLITGADTGSEVDEEEDLKTVETSLIDEESDEEESN